MLGGLAPAAQRPMWKSLSSRRAGESGSRERRRRGGGGRGRGQVLRVASCQPGNMSKLPGSKLCVRISSLSPGPCVPGLGGSTEIFFWESLAGRYPSWLLGSQRVVGMAGDR